MAIHQLDILGISEHNIAMSNHTWRQSLHASIHRAEPKSTTYCFSYSTDQDRRGKLMGGTGIIARGNITGRLEPHGKEGDEIGCWSIMHIWRHQKPPISIIAVYQVCQQPTNRIGDTAWHQQRRTLDLRDRPEHPRTAFLADLTSKIQQLQSRKHSVIVGGDWNAWIGATKSPLQQLCTTLNLTDP